MKLGPGDRLGSYEILSVLGAGGMGEVYRARDSALGRDVAIKVLPDFVFTEPDRLVRFEQEAKAAAALNHPNIVGVYQFGTYEDSPYLVTELLEGETLRDRLEHGPLPLRKTVDYGIQIAHGLAAAHKKGIVHRDLKPENLFLVKDGRVKILDFGVAKILQSDDEDAPGVDSAHLPTVDTKPGVVLGTWGYMSPEQVRGQVVDQRSDIFALGAILHEMVTGKCTFGRPTSADTISAILHDEPAAISQTVPRMPQGLQRVIDRCLEKDADQRFQSASDMAFALEALSDTALASTATRVQVKLQKARKRTALIVAALAALAGAFLLGYWLAHPSPRPKASNYVQLTHDGQPKSLLGSDGARLFLGLGPFPYQGGAEMPTAGGEQRIIAMPSEHAVPLVLSPDGSNLLAVAGQGVPPSGPLWAVPVTGGSPRRLGDLSGRLARGLQMAECSPMRSTMSCSLPMPSAQNPINSARWRVISIRSCGLLTANDYGWMHRKPSVNTSSGKSRRREATKSVCWRGGTSPRTSAAGDGPPMVSISFFSPTTRSGFFRRRPI